MNPLISVVITNYNYGQYVAKAIQSVFEQTYRPLELIIIDDGSTDNSLEIIETAISDASEVAVHVVKQENQGIVATRNKAKSLVNGDYYTFLDADDYFDKDYVERLYKAIKEADADVAYPNWHVIEVDTGKDYRTDFPDFTNEALQRQELHVTPASLVKKASTQAIAYASDLVAEDWDYFMRLGLEGKTFVHAQDAYLNYQVKAGSRASARSYTDDTMLFEEILEQLRHTYGEDKVIERNFIVHKRMSALELDRAAIQERLRVANDNLRILSDSNKSLTGELKAYEAQVDQLHQVINDKDTHIFNLENSRLGKLQKRLRKAKN
jgi:glycosyltransferase involved in cell wall biosynthesis